MTLSGHFDTLDDLFPRWRDAAFPVPPEEAERLRMLHRLHLLDTPREERFDRIARLARRLIDTEMAVISLVDADRQWFKSTCGIDAEETSRRDAFCAHTILGDDILVVEDAREDPRFRDYPMVVDDPHIRFYAGAPITIRGQHVGTLCAVDTRPRSLTVEERGLLLDLVGITEREIAAMALATEDPLTGAMNRAGLEQAGERALAIADRDGTPVTAVYVDINRLKWVNDHLGHAAGDRLISDLAAILEANVRATDIVARIGGDEFLVLLQSTDRPVEMLTRTEQAIRARNDSGRGEPLEATFGYAVRPPGSGMTLSRLMAEADQEMYRRRSRRTT